MTCDEPGISDGRIVGQRVHVRFEHDAQSEVMGGLNGLQQIFVRDRDVYVVLLRHLRGIVEWKDIGGID